MSYGVVTWCAWKTQKFRMEVHALIEHWSTIVLERNSGVWRVDHCHDQLRVRASDRDPSLTRRDAVQMVHTKCTSRTHERGRQSHIQ